MRDGYGTHVGTKRGAISSTGLKAAFTRANGSKTGLTARENSVFSGINKF